MKKKTHKDCLFKDNNNDLKTRTLHQKILQGYYKISDKFLKTLNLASPFIVLKHFHISDFICN